MELNFEILIDDFFEKFCTLDREKFTPINNKKLLSLINDFEDGEWRYNNFNDYIFNNVIEAALSKTERDRLINQDYTRLRAAVKNISSNKNPKTQGSEIAEILLYGIMKDYYGALTVVPKIFYKQNSNDYVKGADSVHIVVEDNNNFSFWFGEAKFYTDIKQIRNINTIIKSVEELLQTDKLKKENSIITNIQDLSLVIMDKELLNRIKSLLCEQVSIDKFKPKLHIPILLLHECKETKSVKEITNKYKNTIIEYHKEFAQSYYSNQILKLAESIQKYSSITFHLILFPVPNKKKIVDFFYDNVKKIKEQ